MPVEPELARNCDAAEDQWTAGNDAVNIPALADSTTGLTLDSGVPAQVGGAVGGFNPATVASAFAATTSKPLAEVRVWESSAAGQPASVELLPASNGTPNFAASPLATATMTGSEAAPSGGQWDTYDFSHSGFSLVAGQQYAIAWRIGSGVNLYTTAAHAGPYLGEAFIDFDQGGVAPPYWYWGTPIYEIYTNPGAVQPVTETVSGASLGFVSAPGAVTPPATTLTGIDQITPAFSLPLDVGDATGTGAGWSVSLNATRFTDAKGHTLGGLFETSEGTPVCDAATTCTAATDAKKVVNLASPLAYAANTLVRVADAGTGMGNQHLSPTYQLAVPANSYAGTYTSTWTVSLNSAPQ